MILAVYELKRKSTVVNNLLPICQDNVVMSLCCSVSVISEIPNLALARRGRAYMDGVEELI